MLDPEEGIRFRGYSIPECQKLLPKAKGGQEPLPEGLFWLLVTSEVPTEAQVQAITKVRDGHQSQLLSASKRSVCNARTVFVTFVHTSALIKLQTRNKERCSVQEWNNRAALPTHVVQMLNNFPSNLHPMAQFSAAITACNSESKFARAYGEGVNKATYWEVSFCFSTNDTRYTSQQDTTRCAVVTRNSGNSTKHERRLSFQYVYEDAMDCIAKLPTIAAIIYRNLYRDGTSVGAIDENKDWSFNFTSMLGYEDPMFTELMRMYLTIHRYDFPSASFLRFIRSLWFSSRLLDHISCLWNYVDWWCTFQ